jgi:hypothetical protein
MRLHRLRCHPIIASMARDTQPANSQRTAVVGVARLDRDAARPAPLAGGRSNQDAGLDGVTDHQRGATGRSEALPIGLVVAAVDRPRPLGVLCPPAAAVLAVVGTVGLVPSAIQLSDTLRVGSLPGAIQLSDALRVGRPPGAIARLGALRIGVVARSLRRSALLGAGRMAGALPGGVARLAGVAPGLELSWGADETADQTGTMRGHRVSPSLGVTPPAVTSSAGVFACPHLTTPLVLGSGVSR